MKIHIEPSILERIPNFKLAVLHYTQTAVSDSPQMLKGRLQLFQEQLFFELEEHELNEIEGIREWRAVWKVLGADPSRYRPSAEAMYRRVRKQSYIESHSSAIDLNTLFSLQYAIPSGMYDASKLIGDVQVTTGQAEDGYDGLNGRFNSLHNLLILKDGYSPFGSPYVDAIRSAVTEESEELLHILFLRPEMDTEEAQRLAEGCGAMFVNINGGEYEATILHAGNASVEMPISPNNQLTE